MCEGEIYMFIRYSDLILAKRCEELTMLNGFILCEPMEEEKLSEIRKTLVLPEYLKKRMSLKYTKVVKIGSRNQEYLNDDYCRDGNEVREGDVVLYEKNYNIECEFDTHQKLGNRYFRIQRKNFAAIVKGGKQKAETISDIQPL
jgi:co-chaperonin GroES (HSP10)